MIQCDTIVAIATPMVPSAIGIVRVSGPGVASIIDNVFRDDASTLMPRQMRTRSAYLPNGKMLDDCCYVYYKGPHSFTGEDVLEIFCHGSTYILSMLVRLIAAQSQCRLSKNGEFTKRAFLNGKLSLSKAESILDIIESDSEASHAIAMNQFKGKVYDTISHLRDALMTMLQAIEASLEFPDDVGGIQSETLIADCDSVLRTLQPIITASDYGRLIKKGVTYLIIGDPNVGKSSLLNALSGESRSIVSDVAGTTRDYIDISVEYDGVLMTLIDTAGIRSTDNDLERLGIEKIKALSDRCDGYIILNDATASSVFTMPDFLDPHKPMVHVVNKVDLTQHSSGFEYDGIPVSCHTGEGLTQLKQALVAALIDASVMESDQILCNLRQISSLNAAFNYITLVKTHLEAQTTLDIVSIDLRDAIGQLSDIVGSDVTEELLDGIFSKFCIGK